MKKGFAILLALVLLLSAGCSAKQEQPAPAAAPTVPETTTASETIVPETTTAPETIVPENTATPETTVPEITGSLPKLETGKVQGENIPAILCLLNRGELVEVTGNPDETHATVKTNFGVGTMEMQLLRFVGEEQAESWTGYARWNTGFFADYEMGGKAPATLETNTKMEVLEELKDCYLVTVDGKTGFVDKAQVSKLPIKISPGSNEDGSFGGSTGGSSGDDTSDGQDGDDTSGGSTGSSSEDDTSGGSTGSSSGDGSSGGSTGSSSGDGSSGGSTGGSSGDDSSGGQDGGDISLAFCGNVYLLSAVTKTGSAQVRVDGAKVVLKYFKLGDTVQIVAEEGFAPALEGYMTILVDDTYAYIPEGWVQKDADPVFESWDGFAGYGCQLYDNYLMKGKAVKQISSNTALTVLWTAGDVSVIRVGDTIGYASTDALCTTRIPAQEGGGSFGGSSGGSEWTLPAM